MGNKPNIYIKYILCTVKKLNHKLIQTIYTQYVCIYQEIHVNVDFIDRRCYISDHYTWLTHYAIKMYKVPQRLTACHICYSYIIETTNYTEKAFPPH